MTNSSSQFQSSLVAFSPIPEALRQKVLMEWNQTQTNFPKDQSIDQLFEVQVKKAPEALAVEWEKERITYRELNQQANRLAHYLHKKGVYSGRLVGIYLERSLEMLVALLGVLKAGGAYLPLEPACPRERISFILNDAQVPLLLTKNSLLAELPQTEINIICLDSQRETIDLESQTSPKVESRASGLAYVIYTSGSTGHPKGVAVPHRAVNRLVCQTNYVQIQSNDRIAQASNIAFDAATFEIWGAWLNGATLIGISKERLLSPADFASQLKDKSITTLFLTTALFNQLASTVPQAFRNLKYLLFGGEVVDSKWVKAILQWGAPQNLLQVYGPTEGTTFSTWYQIKEVSRDTRAIPIGRPISNTQVYLLNSALEPVPIGMTGELYIGGEGLALGYFNRPELTQQKFITNPFEWQKDNDAFPVLPGDSTQKKTRNFRDTKLYKTGDLARYLPDGNIEFVGRVDHQVKIRGYRVELEEVELALNQHPLLRATAVIAREDISDNKRLVAYIVLNDCDRRQPLSSTIPQILRTFLKEKLPEYYIPSAFVILERLPLTLNGKIDREALPAPDISAYHRAADHIPASTIIEETLVNIWTEVLKIEPIGIQDNFFHLGGHSLLATQVLSRIRETFSCELTLKQLFEYPTIAQLSLQIVAAQNKDKMLPLIPGITSHNEELPPLSFAQQRLWFLDQLESNNRAYHLPYFVRLRGKLDVNALKKSFLEIVSRHEILRTSFPEIEGEPRQKIATDFPLPIPLVDLQTLSTFSTKGESSTIDGRDESRAI